VLASLDTAFTEKQSNDPSALTIWGIFRDQGGNPKVMLLGAWEGRLQFHELVWVVGSMCSTSAISDDDKAKYLGWANRGTMTYKELPRFPVDRLIIEAKANGISVAQEIKRIYGGTGEFGVELIDPARLGGDKVARMHAVAHLFEDGMVWAPDTRFADMVIRNVSAFPKGQHDDLVDTTSASLRYMRLTGLLERRDEYQRSAQEAALFKGRERPLYPV
jgi:predicted phage terminase large subunit-like protein